MQREAPLAAALTQGQTRELEDLFEVFDHHGKMYCSDIGVAFQVLGVQLSKEQVQAFVTLYSDDGKFFTKAEFFEIAGEVLLGRQDGEREKMLEEAFSLFDTHGSGAVSAKQLNRVLTRVSQLTRPQRRGPSTTSARVSSSSSSKTSTSTALGSRSGSLCRF
jgi:Ca2+-binding EF-hand superfamily protein